MQVHFNVYTPEHARLIGELMQVFASVAPYAVRGQVTDDEEERLKAFTVGPRGTNATISIVRNPSLGVVSGEGLKISGGVSISTAAGADMASTRAASPSDRDPSGPTIYPTGAAQPTYTKDDVEAALTRGVNRFGVPGVREVLRDVFGVARVSELKDEQYAAFCERFTFDTAEAS